MKMCLITGAQMIMWHQHNLNRSHKFLAAGEIFITRTQDSSKDYIGARSPWRRAAAARLGGASTTTTARRITASSASR